METLARLREEDPSTNLLSTPGEFGVPPLHIAVFRNQIPFINQIMLFINYEDFFTTFQEQTALELSKKLGMQEMTRFLMYRCEMSLEVRFKLRLAEIQAKSCGNQCLLMYMEYRDHTGFADAVKSPRLRSGCVAVPGCPKHFTPLFLAVLLGKTKYVQTFIKNGAMPHTHHVLPEEDYHLLHLAARFDHYKIIPILVKAGCSLYQATRGGHTPLGIAARYGHLRSIKALADSPGFDIQSSGGDSVLHIAAQHGQFHVIRTLIKLGCNVNYCYVDNTVLHIAAAYNHAAVVRILLEYGADPSATTFLGAETPLHLAALKGSCDVVEPLMKVCTHHSLYEVCELNPAELAITCNHTDFLYALCKNGFDMKHCDRYGCSLLHYVVLVRHKSKEDPEDDSVRIEASLLESLISWGCNPHTGNDLGETPLDLAVVCEDAEAIAILEKACRTTADIPQCA